jgi:hypothetical protein
MTQETKEAIIAAGKLAKWAKEQLSETIRERDGWENIAKTNAEANANACQALYYNVQELEKYKKSIEELGECVSKLPKEANYFGAVDKMKTILEKLDYKRKTNDRH